MADPPKMDKMITVRLPSDLHAAVVAKAHAEGPGFSVADLLRSTLQGWVSADPQPTPGTSDPGEPERPKRKRKAQPVASPSVTPRFKHE